MNNARTQGVRSTLPGALLALCLLLPFPLPAQAPVPPTLTSALSSPSRKNPPRLQILPEPRNGASFQIAGKTVFALDGGEGMRRPFLYPVLGPSGLPLTRMGHPHDPVSHSHHNSVWISHNQIGEHNFWADNGGRIETRQISRIEDGDASASLELKTEWLSTTGNAVLHENRRITLTALAPKRWRIDIESELLNATSAPLIAGTSGFGFLGVRMAKTIGVHDGGGRILNSEGAINEPACFRKPSRWVDYSGPVTDTLDEGITLFDHPQNPNHPVEFHVRSDGWMGPCSTLRQPHALDPGTPLRLKYGLLIHSNDITPDSLDEEWRAFSLTEFRSFQKPGSKK